MVLWNYLQGSKGDTDIENGFMDTAGGERRDGMHGDSNVEIYITTCETDIQWEFAVCLRELNRGSVTT